MRLIPFLLQCNISVNTCASNTTVYLQVRPRYSYTILNIMWFYGGVTLVLLWCFVQVELQPILHEKTSLGSTHMRWISSIMIFHNGQGIFFKMDTHLLEICTQKTFSKTQFSHNVKFNPYSKRIDTELFPQNPHQAFLFTLHSPVLSACSIHPEHTGTLGS